MSRKRKEEGEGLEEPRKVCADKEERKKRKESWNCISACSNSRERRRKTNSQNFLHYLEIQRTWYGILGTDLVQECIKTVPFHLRAHLNPARAVGRLKKSNVQKNVECYLVQKTGFIFSSSAAGWKGRKTVIQFAGRERMEEGIQAIPNIESMGKVASDSNSSSTTSGKDAPTPPLLPSKSAASGQ